MKPRTVSRSNIKRSCFVCSKHERVSPWWGPELERPKCWLEAWQVHYSAAYCCATCYFARIGNLQSKICNHSVFQGTRCTFSHLVLLPLIDASFKHGTRPFPNNTTTCSSPLGSGKVAIMRAAPNFKLLGCRSSNFRLLGSSSSYFKLPPTPHSHSHPLPPCS